MISALFDEIQTDGPEVKFKPTNLADLIANNVRLSKKAVREAEAVKNDSRTTQKVDKNWGRAGQLEILRPIFDWGYWTILELLSGLTAQDVEGREIALPARFMTKTVELVPALCG